MKAPFETTRRLQAAAVVRARDATVFDFMVEEAQ